MSTIDSNKFTITVNKQLTEIQIGTDGKTSEVVVYKGVNLLTPVSGTPSTNQYKVTLSSTGCVAGLKSDNKTIYIKSISSSNANITVSINVENIHTYIKNISVVKIINEYEISNMKSAVSSIEQKADSITSKVNEVQYNLTNNYSTTVMMNSAIEQKANSITSTISKIYTTKDELNNLNIGSRNFLLETDDHKLCVGNGSENQSFLFYKISDPGALAGKTVTLSFQYRVTNWQGEGEFLPQTAHNTRDCFEQYWLWSEGTFTYTSTINFSNSNRDTEVQIRCDWLKGTIEILPKTAVLVIGNKATGWSPAPEDVENEIMEVSSKIEQTAEALTATFNNGYYQGITQVNADGIKVYHTSIDSNSYTHVSPAGFYLKNKGTDIFKVDSNGLYLKGNINATSGTIGGYTITDCKLSSGNVGMCSNIDRDYAFWAGGSDGYHSPFRVGHDGWLYASNASITGTIESSTITGSTIKSGTEYNPNLQNITGLKIQDDTIYSYGTKNNGIYAVTKISGGTINIGNGADGAGLNWSAHVSSSDISLFRQGSSGYFYVGATDVPESGSSKTTTTIDTNTINIGSKDVTTAFKVDYNANCEFGNNYFTRGSLTINQNYQGTAKGTQTYLSGTTISATNIYQNGSAVSGSDIVLKDNIKEYKDSALDIINQTKVYSFNRILANQDKTEIGFLAQQVPDIFIFDKGEFTAEELDGLTAEDKKTLLAKKTEDYKAVLENRKLDEISENVASFYDLDSKQTEEQIERIMDEYHNIEYEVPISTINQNNIIAVMFKAIQELSAKIDKLEIH